MLESIKKEVKGDLENAFLNLGEQVCPSTPQPIPSGHQLSGNCAIEEVTGGHPVHSSVWDMWFLYLIWVVV